MKSKAKSVAFVACVIVIVLMGMSIATASKSFEDRVRAEIKDYVPAVSAMCKDGTYSTSKRDKGTCSKHGGVRLWMK